MKYLTEVRNGGTLVTARAASSLGWFELCN